MADVNDVSVSRLTANGVGSQVEETVTGSNRPQIIEELLRDAIESSIHGID